MPVTVQSRGYSDRLMPVPTPTSSTRSPACDAHPLDRLHAAGMQRRAEGEVVDLGELVVDALDEVVLDGGHRQRARGRVGSGNQVFFALGFTVE